MRTTKLKPAQCFACRRPLIDENTRTVKTEDGQTVFVGGLCYRKISASGSAGWQAPKGGPKLFTLTR